ncbi:MAG: hypothetical protein ACI9KE_004585 [Polyangiales bacterium]|jgi:hypothetical protein
MTELNLLRVLLLVGFVLAPLGTHRLLMPPSRLGTTAHAAAFVCAAIGLFAIPLLCVGWLVFTAGSFARFLRHANLRSPYGLASCVPFAFSNIAAVWLVGGANEVEILGYGETFSYYAALHGNVLGWMMVGAIAVLAAQDRPYRRLYLASVLVCFGSFLIIAIGIKSLPAIKPVGVLGLSVMIPIAQLAFLRSVWRTHKVPFALGCTSFLGLAFTMMLAWQNELGVVSLPGLLGVRTMVSVHGLINILVVAPCFLLAVVLASLQKKKTKLDVA